jgi:hypothetical protein
MLLFKLGQHNNIRALLIQYNNQMAHAKLFAGIVPSFENSFDDVYEADSKFKDRSSKKRASSILLTTLLEWTVVINDQKAYKAFVDLITKVFKNVDLILWFPDKDSEKVMFRDNAMAETGYALSNIKATDDYESFRNLLIIENEHNSPEIDFYFFKLGFWATGLIPIRHYRTYVYPAYVRSLIQTDAQT